MSVRTNHSVHTEMTSVDSLDAAIQELDIEVNNNMTLSTPIGGFDDSPFPDTPTPSHSQAPSRTLRTQKDRMEAFKNRALTPVD